MSGNEDEPGIIPRAMKDVFGFIKKTVGREYLLRCSYLEIYNESIHDLLAPPSMAAANPVQIQGGAGGTDVILTPLREEVVTSLKGVKEVLKRGEGNRRTACTDWNDRSSRSHSVFRLVIESRERGGDRSMNEDEEGDDVPSSAGATGGRVTPAANGRHTPGLNGRQTPGLNGRQTPGPGGPRLQARGGRSVQTSVLVSFPRQRRRGFETNALYRVSLTWLVQRKQHRTRNERERASISTRACSRWVLSSVHSPTMLPRRRRTLILYWCILCNPTDDARQ